MGVEPLGVNALGVKPPGVNPEGVKFECDAPGVMDGVADGVADPGVTDPGVSSHRDLRLLAPGVGVSCIAPSPPPLSAFGVSAHPL